MYLKQRIRFAWIFYFLFNHTGALNSKNVLWHRREYIILYRLQAVNFISYNSHSRCSDEINILSVRIMHIFFKNCNVIYFHILRIRRHFRYHGDSKTRLGIHLMLAYLSYETPLNSERVDQNQSIAVDPLRVQRGFIK